MSPNRQEYKVNNKENVETIYQFPSKPEPKPFSQFLYNTEDGSILGRTPKNWGKLSLFYIIFYIVLGCMFSICLQGLFSTLSDDYPKWQLNSSLIGASPGMSFRPFIEAEERSTVIKYKASSEKEVSELVEAINEFLTPFRNNTPPSKTKRVPCDFDKPPKKGEVCNFEIDSSFGECANNSSYGYNTSAPCVFLKLNKIFGWVPEYYNKPADLPHEMPDELVKYIKSINNTKELDQIWVSCKGRKEGKVREINFIDSRGFPGYFYPFMNLDGYKSPLIPIQIRLEPNEIKEDNIVQIECRAWARNIIYSGSLRDRQGSVLIALNIDK